MAATREETAITWSSAAYQDCTTNGTIYISDAITLNAGDWEGEVALYADNQGTPASGDLATLGILYSCGNVDGSAGDDYTNPENYEFLKQLDTYNNDNASSPDGIVSATVPVRTAPKAFKIVAVKAGASTIRVRAALITRRSAVT